VFDRVERWRFLEQPARKDLVPAQRLIGRSAFFNQHLHESPGLDRQFPWLAAFAAGQLDDYIAKTPRFANLHRHILRDVVALVEQAQCCHPVLHGGAIFAFNDGSGIGLRGRRLGGIAALGGGAALPLTSGKRQRGEHGGISYSHRVQESGVQAW
jgi:hypothetical protein